MIHVSVSAKGTVALRPTKTVDHVRLKKLAYVINKRQRYATYWTYLTDLRRDIPASRLRWDKGVVPAIKKLKHSVATMTKGRDEDVTKFFAEGKKPYQFQLEAIHAAISRKRLLIADDTGLGKTIETIGVLLYLLGTGKINRGVLVVPAGLKHQWAEQIDEFAATVPHPVLIAQGKPGVRHQLYARPWKILIINPELVRIDRKHLAKICDSVGFVALDEASMIRNPETKIARCMNALWRLVPYRIALTATPVENRLADLFSVIQWVEPRAFISKPYFDKRYILWKKKIFSVFSKKHKKMVRVVQWVPSRYRNLNEVHSKIRHCYIRRKVSDVGMELPALVVQWDTLIMPKRQRDCYQAVKDRLEGALKKLRGAALAAPLQALRQACNSTWLVEKDQGQKHCAVKIDRIRELLETEFAGEQVIIFTDYERFAKILKTELSEYRPVTYTGKMGKRERQRAVDAFRLGNRRVLIGTQALERGHNLQNAAIVINADLPYNPAALKQRLGRVRRLGSQHQVVRLWNMVCENTVEDQLVKKQIYVKRKLFEGIFTDDELSYADPLEEMQGKAIWDLV